MPPSGTEEQSCYSPAELLGRGGGGGVRISRLRAEEDQMTTQEGKSSTERPKIKNFLLNPDNEGLMTYIFL